MDAVAAYFFAGLAVVLAIRLWVGTSFPEPFRPDLDASADQGELDAH